MNQMKTPVDQIAEKLISAAHELFGALGDPEAAGGDYIADVTKDTDVPAYFKEMAALAAAPRSMDLYDDYQQNRFNQDAECVMDAGLKQLLTVPALPPEQRSIIESVKAFQAWTEEVTHQRGVESDKALSAEIWPDGIPDEP